ncbi:MAG: RnfABCDGE type electron transport complex subunit D [Oscillospiraceae bacterium]|jgi:Na+-translocating ferredoxin:NAD+ oxidoreductase RnfD subunit|nr:RnfABCDGE type electron transport complex subunit D [Oscillospiraceae bacterium]
MPNPAEITLGGKTPTEKLVPAQEAKYYQIALLMLMLPVALAWYYYRGQALRQVVICALAALASEWVVRLIFRKSMNNQFDCGSLFTGAAIALCLPANAPIYVGVSAAMFAVLVAALPFGGVHRAPFIPAAAGMAFAVICFKDAVFSYPPIMLDQSASVIPPGESLASLLQNGVAPRLDVASMLDLLLGKVSGPMGSGCLTLILGTVFFTFLLGKEAFCSSAGFLAGIAAYAALFPRVPTDSLNSVLLELSAGAAMLCGVCLLHHPASRPKHWAWCIAYGAYSAVAVMCFRRFGAYEEGAWFAILFSNGTWGIVQELLTKLWALTPWSRKELPEYA